MSSAVCHLSVLESQSARSAPRLSIRERQALSGESTYMVLSLDSEFFDFFSFYRSMQAYEAALSGESTFMVLSPDSEFFDHFSSVRRKPAE